MSTIAGEITRISSGKGSIINSTNTKLRAQGSSEIPANTKIDEIYPYIDSIQQGGGQENAFLTETDLSYMFDYRNSGDDKIIAGIQRISQNNITNLQNCFYNFNDNRVSTVPADAGLVIGYIQNMIRNHPSVDMSYVIGYFTFPDVSAYDFVLDLSEIQLSNSVRNMFSYSGISSGRNARLVILIDKDTFSNSTNCSSLFQNAKNCVYLKNKDNKICVGGSMQNAFNMSYTKFLDASGNEIKELTFEVENYISFQSAFSNSYASLERLNFIDSENISNFNGMLQNVFTMKSVTGLDFSGADGTTNANIFNTSGSTYFDSFGELGIVNGSVFKSNKAVNLNLTRIWHGVTTDIRDGQTIGYWYEKFANALGTKTSTNTHTITINTTLYNSLTQTQKELITNKGYVLASAS